MSEATNTQPISASVLDESQSPFRSAQVSKRALTAGLGLGTLALLSQTQRSSAQTVGFTNFAFPATGAPASRTVPDRLAETKNVKDFGAKGNGTTDDTAAIQAAINAAAATGSNALGAQLGCDVFFPPGVYAVSSPLIANIRSAIRLIGSGRESCTIVGNFAGYIINQTDTNAGWFNAIEGLYIKNIFSGAGGGGIRFSTSSTDACTIRRCYVQAFNAINATPDSFNLIISECIIVTPFNSGTAGTVGIYAAQVGIYNCVIMGWDVGVQASNVGMAIIGSRIETCNTGILLGLDSSGAGSTATATLIAALTTERCNTAIYLYNAGNFQIAGADITGTVAVDGVSLPSYGIRVRNANNGLISGVAVSVYASVAGIDLGSVIGGTNTTFVSVNSNTNGNGPNWTTPANYWQSSFSFINCNNPSEAFAFAYLPGQPGTSITAVEGMQFDISDCNAATWGAIAAGGGSTHARVRYNGTKWTVIGI